MLRKLYYLLPAKMRFVARRALFLPIDLWDSWTGKRADMVPPKGMIFTGSGDFVEQGKRLLELFKDIGGLQPDHRVLDIGSGIGRSALPLTSFLTDKGSYQGFDPIEKGIVWCKKNISSRYSNFKFDYIPLKNDLYRDDGASAANFKFPYADNSFDFVILTSVFSHMVSDEVQNYLKEIERVISPSGIVFSTFFILDKESTSRSERSSFKFLYPDGDHWLMDAKVISANVAYEKEILFEKIIASAQLKVDKFYPGFWSGLPKTSCKDFQDILILKKP